MKVRFASEKAEKDYLKLADSDHPEDRRLHRALTRLREEVLRRQGEGSVVTDPNVLSAYQDVLGDEMLLSLELPGEGTVLYSVSGDEILIVDQL